MRNPRAAVDPEDDDHHLPAIQGRRRYAHAVGASPQAVSARSAPDRRPAVEGGPTAPAVPRARRDRGANGCRDKLPQRATIVGRQCHPGASRGAAAARPVPRHVAHAHRLPPPSRSTRARSARGTPPPRVLALLPLLLSPRRPTAGAGHSTGPVLDPIETLRGFDSRRLHGDVAQTTCESGFAARGDLEGAADLSHSLIAQSAEALYEGSERNAFDGIEVHDR